MSGRTSGPKRDRDRRDRILQAALEEFVERGYEGASTNAIARRAGVAKGLVFHHFGSKQELYLRLVDEALETLLQGFVEAGGDWSADLFDRMLEWSKRKLQLFQANPLLYQLVTDALARPPEAVHPRLTERYQRLADRGWALFLEGIDTSRLRPGLTLGRAVEVLMMALDGAERRYLPRLAALPDRGLGELGRLQQEVRDYLLILRDGMYRPPGPGEA